MNGPVWAERSGDEAIADHVAEAMSGGGTAAVPASAASEAILRSLAGRPLPWDRTAFTLTDDCEVAPDHPASRYGRLVGALGETGVVLARFAPVWEDFRFRLVLIEVGADGAVASILPGLPLEPDAPPDLARSPRPKRPPPGEPFPRTTLNYAALANCDELIAIVRDEGGKAAVEAAEGGGSDLPVARLLRRIEGPVTIFRSAP
ncbi:MAG TPA: 6-phosphogluconolactonase [Allosphingosinicella sp.]|nr:6-phosphogluconolactonase [Allosphingosinicella sp.]